MMTKPEHKKHNGIAISFNKTIEEILSKKKTVTRRDWCDRTANTFTNYYRNKLLVKGVDKTLRNGGKQICWLKLTKAPYLEPLCNMPAEHVEREGGMTKTVAQFIDRYFNGEADKKVWVVEFEVVEITTEAQVNQ